jgi:23S rRNA (guanosine2251-2'-O)-methyltransferase
MLSGEGIFVNNLRRSRFVKRDHQQHDLLFGVNPVREQLESAPGKIVEIIVAEGRRGDALRVIEESATRHRVKIVRISGRELDRMLPGLKHQGVAARVGGYGYHPLSALIEAVEAARGPDWILALDSLTDPRNFGAILRSAEAVGLRDVIVPKDRAVGVTPVVVKTSAGAAKHLRIYQAVNLRTTLAGLRARGYWTVGLDPTATETIYDRVYPAKVVIVVGAEGAGVRPLVRSECDFLASIPMLGQVGSLNVSVAAAVFFYELLRRKGQNRALRPVS